MKGDWSGVEGVQGRGNVGDAASERHGVKERGGVSSREFFCRELVKGKTWETKFTSGICSGN